MWEQIRSNRRRSAVVVVLMGMLLIGTGMILGGLFAQSAGGLLAGGMVAFLLWLGLWIVTIKGGDDVMLQMAGAKEIRKQDHPMLVNVVEEMSIAAALPDRPRIFIVDDPSPNAFATGRDPRRSAVAVTTGLLRVLNRDELQGVVAHEVGHIKNRDVALITTAGIMVGCIVLLAEIGLRAMWFGAGTRRSRSSSNQGGGAQVAMLVVGLVLLILAPILAQLIYFALSRRREFLADASGAMFTRYPEGLAAALEKISGEAVPLADESRVTAPMYIVRPMRAKEKMAASSLMATHPPIRERVHILRAMGGNAGLAAYEQAYRKVRKEGLVGAQTLAAAAEIKAAKPRAEAQLAESPHQRARQASNAFLAASGYIQVECGSCGATVKVPPSLKARLRSCPRCHAVLKIKAS